MLLILISGLAFSCGSMRTLTPKNPASVIIKEASGYLGVPYKWGGLSRQGLDCSGLVKLAFSKAGISVPRTTEGLMEAGKRVKLKKVKPGDLLFFALSEKKNQVTHVGIVTKKQRGQMPEFIHASTSKGVVNSDLKLKYYKEGFRQARRLLK